MKAWRAYLAKALDGFREQAEAAMETDTLTAEDHQQRTDDEDASDSDGDSDWRTNWPDDENRTGPMTPPARTGPPPPPPPRRGVSPLHAPDGRVVINIYGHGKVWFNDERRGR